MKINNQQISSFLVLSAVISFFVGFALDEISMGAGGFGGDFIFVKESIILFSENSILNSIKLFSETSNRPPLIYILHKLFNPLFTDELGFRRIVFSISIIIPILFYFCLKEKFKKIDKNLLLLLSSILFLNPFYRTSAYWGLEENYAIISTLLAFLFLLKLLNLKKISFDRSCALIFLITFFSSLSIYFDQKFLIVPLICFEKIMMTHIPSKTKFICNFFYFLFSIPYLYLINLWGGIFPSDIYKLGNEFYFHHFGYALTIIAFIFFPFFFLKSKNLKDQFLSFYKEKNILINFLIILSYLFVLFFFYNDSFLSNKLDGGGVVKKISLLFLSELYLKKIFTFFAILISWFLILMFAENKKKI